VSGALETYVETCAAVVEPERTAEVLRLLKKRGVLNRRFRIVRREGFILIPVTDPIEASRLGLRVTKTRLPLNYRGLTFKDLLVERIPEEVLNRIPRSFDIIGDIALIELSPEDAKIYGKIIAEAIMKLHPNIKSVYARGRTLGLERVRELMHIGGEKRTTTVHREYGLKIFVDIARVYFNPSLAEEHRRIATYVKDGELILDMFAGTGPFSLHIASIRKATVISIDVNPRAIECLRVSIMLNKLRGDLHPLVADSSYVASMFLSQFDRVIMNLPQNSLNFLSQALEITKRNAYIYLYTIAPSCSDAVKMLQSTISKISVDKKVKVENCVRILPYSPRRYIYRINLCTV